MNALIAFCNTILETADSDQTNPKKYVGPPVDPTTGQIIPVNPNKAEVDQGILYTDAQTHDPTSDEEEQTNLGMMNPDAAALEKKQRADIDSTVEKAVNAKKKKKKKKKFGQSDDDEDDTEDTDSDSVEESIHIVDTGKKYLWDFDVTPEELGKPESFVSGSYINSIGWKPMENKVLNMVDNLLEDCNYLDEGSIVAQQAANKGKGPAAIRLQNIKDNVAADKFMKANNLKLPSAAEIETGTVRAKSSQAVTTSPLHASKNIDKLAPYLYELMTGYPVKKKSLGESLYGVGKEAKAASEIMKSAPPEPVHYKKDDSLGVSSAGKALGISKGIDLDAATADPEAEALEAPEAEANAAGAAYKKQKDFTKDDEVKNAESKIKAAPVEREVKIADHNHGILLDPEKVVRSRGIFGILKRSFGAVAKLAGIITDPEAPKEKTCHTDNCPNAASHILIEPVNPGHGHVTIDKAPIIDKKTGEPSSLFRIVDSKGTPIPGQQIKRHAVCNACAKKYRETGKHTDVDPSIFDSHSNKPEMHPTKEQQDTDAAAKSAAEKAKAATDSYNRENTPLGSPLKLSPTIGGGIGFSGENVFQKGKALPKDPPIPQKRALLEPMFPPAKERKQAPPQVSKNRLAVLATAMAHLPADIMAKIHARRGISK